jgi:LmbE family N-acetylglucosaminyl deacetylase
MSLIMNSLELGLTALWLEPVELFPGRIVIVVPHMDDEVLACGGTLARLPQKEQIHLIYATDGMKSPAPILPHDAISPDLGEIREKESIAAMGLLGVPPENLHFLRLPDGRLSAHRATLRAEFCRLLAQIRPQHVLVPFRYDRHPDHLAINHVLTAVYQEGVLQGELVEYFVYHQWRLLPKGDVRCYIQPGLLRQVDVTAVVSQKLAALQCFKSQTTRFYPWQSRPNLTPALLEYSSQQAEQFLPYDPALPGAAVFVGTVFWIRLAHWLEPFLKKYKDRLVFLWQRGCSNR